MVNEITFDENWYIACRYTNTCRDVAKLLKMQRNINKQLINILDVYD